MTDSCQKESFLCFKWIGKKEISRLGGRKWYNASDQSLGLMLSRDKLFRKRSDNAEAADNCR